MSNQSRWRLGVPGRHQRTVPILTVGLLAVLLAYADGFVVQALQGATGAIERSQHPFSSWLRQSTLMLPVFVLVVLGVLALAHRRYGPELRTPKPVLLTGLLMVIVGTVVGIAAATANAAYNYHLQANQLQLAHTTHSSALAGDTASRNAADPESGHSLGVHTETGTCTGSCLAQRQTLQTHVRGVTIASGYLLGTNLLLVAWVVALRGGRLDVVPTEERAKPSLPTPSLRSGGHRLPVARTDRAS
jgi:hypothetical protein